MTQPNSNFGNVNINPFEMQVNYFSGEISNNQKDCPMTSLQENVQPHYRNLEISCNFWARNLLEWMVLIRSHLFRIISIPLLIRKVLILVKMKIANSCNTSKSETWILRFWLEIPGSSKICQLNHWLLKALLPQIKFPINTKFYLAVQFNLNLQTNQIK